MDLVGNERLIMITTSFVDPFFDGDIIARASYKENSLKEVPSTNSIL